MSVNEPEDNRPTPEAGEIPVESDTLEEDNAQDAEVRPTNPVENPAPADADPHRQEP